MSGISRATQGWMLLTQVAIMVPLMDQASHWTLAIVSLCLLWRLGIFFARWASPPRWLLNLLGIGTAAALFSQLSGNGTMATLINLLLLGYSLKSIETKSGKDLMVVLLTGYFLIGLHLIDRFGAIMSVQLILMVALNSACMLSNYRSQETKHTFILSLKLIVASLPLAIALFVLIPRLPPMWQIQTSTLARTGLSDSMALGDIAQLTRSDELVMRASFTDDPPPAEQLYWRALILDSYDGRRWSASANVATEPAEHYQPMAPFLDYSLQVEANNQTWLATLRGSRSDSSRLRPQAAQQLHWQVPLISRTKIDLQQGYYPAAMSLSLEAEQQNLLLPAHGNPLARQWAQQLREQYPQPQQRMAAIMSHFRQNPFRYTLSPPPLGGEQIDGFLFNTKAGFCGHYASTMVFVARAAGVPARIVTGYQGGERGLNNEFVSVYQYNAHAWVEFWLPLQGWQRIDPTAAVAPERVEQGAEATLSQQPEFSQQSGLFTWRNSRAIWHLRGVLEQLDYQWSRHVIGFDHKRQISFWQEWLGGFQWWKLAVLLGFILLLVGISQSGLLSRTKPTPTPIRLYNKAQQRLSRWGIQRLDNEAPLAHLERVQQHSQALYDAYLPFCRLFIEVQYQATPTPAKIKRLRGRFQFFIRQTNQAKRRGPVAVKPVTAHE